MASIFNRKSSPFFYAAFKDERGRRIEKSTGIRVSEPGAREKAQAVASRWETHAYDVRVFGKAAAPADIDFDALMLQWYRDAAIHFPDRDAKRRSEMKHLYRMFTGQQMRSITRSDILTYIRQRRQQKAAASTINKELNILSGLIDFANEQLQIDLPRITQGCHQSEPEGIVRWLTQTEADRLLQAAYSVQRAPHLGDLVKLALYTGMRKGEMLGLVWRRVDMQENLLYLDQQDTKGKRRRSIPLNTQARAALLGRAGFRAKHCPDSPWVFCNRKGEQIRDVKGGWRTALSRAGIERFRFHDLRHTYASWLVQRGVPLLTVQQLLGHRSYESTQVYAHLAPENLRDATSVLDTENPRMSDSVVSE